MILRLIRYLRGYLDVCFTGVRSEQILTKLNKERITVWGLKYRNGTIFCKMAAKDFRRIRAVRKGTGVKVSIKARRGLPFFIRKYRHRAGFIAGAVIFFMILKFLSCFVWIINVNGNLNVSSASITGTLKEIGIYETMPTENIDAKNNAQSLLLLRDDLAWASINLEGCVINVNVSEIKKRIDDENALPCNLIAESDGIIRKINAVSGNVVVKVGDCVHKGDILVSGIIESLSSTVFTESNGEVIAQVEKTYFQTAGFTRKIKTATGKIENRRVFEILGVRIPLYLQGKDEKADISYKREQLRILGRRIPITVFTAVRE
ncbi:MAG: sporulation protein YqfD, partial [Clostridia bacterium]|nr:sporulation protein YqfD [Clostridia bacterium]